MSQTLLAVLAENTPHPTIDVLTPAWGVDLVGRMPQVRRAIPLTAGHGQLALRARWRLARSLRRDSYDQAIVLKRTLKSALVPWLAGIPRRTGVLGESRFGLINDVRTVTDAQVPLNHARYVAVGQETSEPVRQSGLPMPSLTVDEANRESLIRRLDLGESVSSVGLAPGAAYGPAKRWPLEHWIGLARGLVAGGRGVWVFGSAAEAAVGDRIREAVGPTVINLAGRTTLTDVVDLASACGRFVSNDSGLMHLAAASGTHVVALFGSTSPLNTPPLSDRTTVLWRRLDCSPCFARVCPLGHLDCLTGISPQDVLAACRIGLESGEEVDSMSRTQEPPEATDLRGPE